MKKFLSMAALAVVGAVMTGCSSDDSLTGKAQEPAVKNNVVTLTTTVNLGGDGTRALGADGKKTFAAGDKIAVIYKDTDGNTQKAESEALTQGGGSSATFTVTLEAPKGGEPVRYIYPASMAAATVATNTAVNADATINYAALASQDGTLNTLASKYDLAVFDGSLTADATLPASSTLANQLAIVAYTIKNAGGTSDLTGNITRLTVSDGPNTYGVSRTAAGGPVYIAIRPTSDATISIMATTGTTTYTKSLAPKTYAANNIYKAGLKMTEVPGAIPGMFSTSSSGGKVVFSKGNLQYIGSAATPYWQFAEHQYDYLNTTTSQNSDATDVDRDLFGWGTSGSAPSGQTARAPYYTSTTTNTDYVSNITTAGESWGTNSEWDWGHNAISNGGNTANSGWRTLSSAEWMYLFNTRTNASSLYGHGKVGDVNGMIILPDSWSLPSGLSFTAGKSAWTNSYTTDVWSQMEAAGAVFLPAAGYRDGSSVNNAGSIGYYWSSTASGPTRAYYVYISSGNLNHAGNYLTRYDGFSVRLVRDVE